MLFWCKYNSHLKHLIVVDDKWPFISYFISYYIPYLYHFISTSQIYIPNIGMGYFAPDPSRSAASSRLKQQAPPRARITSIPRYLGRRELAGKNVTRFMWLLQDRETDVLIGIFHEDLVLDYAKKSLMGFTSPKNRILLEWYKIRVGR